MVARFLLAEAEDNEKERLSLVRVKLSPTIKLFYSMRLLRYLLPGLGLVLLLLAGAFVTPDDTFVKLLVTRLATFYTQRFPEKSYLHLDKAVYASGETIWFKAYLVEAGSHRPDTLSRVLYVDLVSPARKVIGQRVLQVSAGTAHGDLALADTLTPGTYTVRAYTNWMRNTDPEFVFTRRIAVWQADAEAAAPVAGRRRRASAAPVAVAPVPAPEVHFFPEGGALLAGQSGVVAFKATDAYGQGLAVAGTVEDEKGARVTTFQSLHLGMGRFQLTPAAGKRYQARVQWPDGRQVVYPLPATQAAGFLLHLSTEGDYINVVIRRKTTNAAPAESILLLGHVRDQPSYIGRGQIDDATGFTARIPRSKFPAGIVHFTLFNAQNIAQAERLLFVRQPGLQVRVTPDKPAYALRERVNLAVQVTDAAGQPTATQLSLTVNNAQALTATDLAADNILSNLLLTSDLRGYVEQPGYYFQSEAPEVTLALDNLLLTQGWRRFIWKELLGTTAPPYPFALERGLNLGGQVVDKNGQPIAEAPVTLFIAEPTRAVASGTTDAEGGFRFSGFDGRDTVRALLQARGVKGNRNPMLRFAPPWPAVSSLAVPPLVPQSEGAVASSLQQSKKQLQAERQYRRDTTRSILLGNVTVQGRKVAPDNRRLHSAGSVSSVINMRDLPAATSYVNILQALQGRVAGLTITGNGFDMQAQIRGQDTPLFILDGVPTDISITSSIAPVDVESIEILKGPAAAIYGSRGGGGVIAIYTKRGNPDYDYSKDPVPPNRANITLTSYYQAREFYVPRYADGKAPNRPDYRSTTLFWAPQVNTDAAGRAQVSFYCSDAGGDFRVAAEGLSAAGQPGVGGGSFRVNQ